MKEDGERRKEGKETKEVKWKRQKK